MSDDWDSFVARLDPIALQSEQYGNPGLEETFGSPEHRAMERLHAENRAAFRRHQELARDWLTIETAYRVRGLITPERQLIIALQAAERRRHNQAESRKAA